MVSEELSSMEIEIAGAGNQDHNQFQKNLVVWKLNIGYGSGYNYYQFQKNLVVWKFYAFNGYEEEIIFRFQKNLVVWKFIIFKIT